MHSPFIESNVGSVVLQTSTSRFLLSSSKFLNSLHNTANIVKWTVIRAVRRLEATYLK